MLCFLASDIWDLSVADFQALARITAVDSVVSNNTFEMVETFDSY